ncbi:MAG: hypothetical protein MI747_06735 [Desulfobacterales bacterium]|nr:hypothetical protein [Desulfobacterales bacterium]
MTAPVFAEGEELGQYEMPFKNFVTCELTRNGAKSPFKGKPFTIVSLDLYSVARELDLTVVTGAVHCFVKGDYKTLYVAAGVRKVVDRERVQYFLVRHKDFNILGTELMRYPYKQRCTWNRYWVNTDL